MDSPTHRFIPTGVGNGKECRRSSTPRPVHPHRRGERFCQCYHGSTGYGSSPQAWGTGDEWYGVPKINRFIPTGVGNGFLPPIGFEHAAVHPHRRGERDARQRALVNMCGSSPQAWGTALHNREAGSDVRFIPTGVGNGQGPRKPAETRTVHPHRRGERRLYFFLQFRFSGSSPQAWGTVFLGLDRQHFGRFIPTGVGNGN